MPHFVAREPGGEVLLHGVLRVGAPDGGQVLLHIPTGTYLKVDRSAALIVELLSEAGSPAEAALRLVERFEIPLPRAEADVRSVVVALQGLQRQPARRVRRPGFRTGARVVRAWWSLALDLRWAVARTVVVLCVVELGLRLLDVQRLASLLRTPLGAPDHGAEAGVPPGDASRLEPSEQRDLVAIEWVARRWINPMTCLRQALVTGYFLRRRHPTLRLGLMADGTTAHAWVEAEGVGYGMSDVAGVFRPIR